MRGASRPRHCRVLIPVLVASVLVAAPVYADFWYEHYQKGEDALKAKKWDEAVSQFTLAIGKKGDPGVNVKTIGLNYVNYFPYFKLGIAYLGLRQTDAALQSFDTEERLGAIAKSAADLNGLKRYRQQAQEAKQAAGAEAQARIAKAVAAAAEEARSLEQKGQLADALTALGKALALDPQNAQALEATDRVRGLLAARERDRDEQDRLAGLVREARDLMAAGKYEEASAKLSQAASVRRTEEIAGLLDQSQSRLRAQIESSRNAEARRALVTGGLQEAARLEQAGQYADALQRLQAVIAVEPQNREALAIRDRLAKLQAETEATTSRNQEADRLLAAGRKLMADLAYEKALEAFNMVLALDPQNSKAIEAIGQVYVELNRAFIGAGKVAYVPPALLLTDLTNEVDASNNRLQRVSSADYRLGGYAFAAVFPVEARVFDATAGGESLLFHEVWSKAEAAGADRSAYQFSVPLRLKSGLTVLRMTVTDNLKQSVSREYRLLYKVPLWRSPWLYGGFALVAVFVAASVTGYRVRRRNLLLKRRFNPYIAGRPVLDDDLFLGREKLLSHILETIHNNSILLYGERRIGKTSLQHHLKKRLERLQDPVFHFFPVFIDLQGTPEDRFFRTLADDIFEQLGPVLDGARPGASLAEGEPYTSHAFVRDVHDVLKTLRTKSEKKVKLVLLVDEVDALNEYDPKVNQKLRSLFMKTFAENLVAVASGVAIKKHWESEGSPWYNFFHEIQVKPFTEADARELIERPIRGIIRLDDGVVDRIIARTSCRPYLIQKLCVALVKRLHDEGRSRITLADVEAIGNGAVE